ncbi:hypothetical protein DPMN_106030 [Dreissena polymorpha]|uniref:Uncharacterized protein n=1 Tax=Dreissena polymorpha TaxID=45954 RepID=A0A9D4K4C3_DREPO|nr:hypothetical protein DPMN_106030 [Dreissena polymorpha]
MLEKSIFCYERSLLPVLRADLHLPIGGICIQLGEPDVSGQCIETVLNQRQRKRIFHSDIIQRSVVDSPPDRPITFSY